MTLNPSIRTFVPSMNIFIPTLAYLPPAHFRHCYEKTTTVLTFSKTKHLEFSELHDLRMSLLNDSVILYSEAERTLLLSKIKHLEFFKTGDLRGVLLNKSVTTQAERVLSIHSQNNYQISEMY